MLCSLGDEARSPHLAPGWDNLSGIDTRDGPGYVKALGSRWRTGGGRRCGAACPRCGRPGYAGGRTKLSGSGPVRSPTSSASMAAISASVRWKSKTAKFSSMRSGVTDLGMTTLPS